jgi:ATP-dependent protease ClpP protease subunit
MTNLFKASMTNNVVLTIPSVYLTDKVGKYLMQHLDHNREKNVIINVNYLPGGYIDTVMFVGETIEKRNKNIKLLINGLICSAGLLLLTYFDPVNVYSTDLGALRFHLPTGCPLLQNVYYTRIAKYYIIQINELKRHCQKQTQLLLLNHEYTRHIKLC